MLFQTNVEKDGYREWFNNLPCNIEGSVLSIKVLRGETIQADIADAKKKDTYETVSRLTNILEITLTNKTKKIQTKKQQFNINLFNFCVYCLENNLRIIGK